MNLIDRIQISLMLRRADNIIRNAAAAREHRAHINRPHVQSPHLISYPVPKAQPARRNIEYGIGPFYAACVICLVGLVAYLNAYHRDPGVMYACNQVASK